MIRPSFPCHLTLLASAKSVFCGAMLMSCGQESTPVNNADRPLLATTPPVARMVEAIMGHPVDQLIPDGMDAKEWTPSELQLVQMSKSFLISNGRGFEAKLRRYDLPRTSWLRSANVLAEPPVLHDVVEHQHGPEGSHSHGVVDGHTWVDPQTAGKQLEAIRQRLVQEGFCSEEQSQQNVRPLLDQLQQIHQAFSEIDPQSIVYYANRAASVSMPVRSLTEIFLSSGSKLTSKTFRSMSLSRGLSSSAGTIIGAVASNMLVRDTINTHHPTKVQAIRSGQLALGGHPWNRGHKDPPTELPRLSWDVLVGWGLRRDQSVAEVKGKRAMWRARLMAWATLRCSLAVRFNRLRPYILPFGVSNRRSSSWHL